MRLVLCAALIVLPPALAITSSSTAHAQADDRALALDLFGQGRTLLAARDYAGALAKFEAAGKVMRTFGILINIAECQEKLGRTASAWASWREARAVASEGHKSDDEAMATQREKALEPQLVRLTVVVPASTDLPDLEVRKDGTLVPRAAWGSAIPIDPGTHVIEGRAPGRKPRSVEVVVQAGGPGATATVGPLELEPQPGASPLLAPPPAAPVVALPPRASQPAVDNSGTGQRIAGWVLIGLGVAAGGTGVAVAVAGQNQHDQAVATDLAGNPSLAQSQESSANTTKLIGYATIGGGGAFLVSGLVLLLTAHSSSASSGSRMVFSPWVGSNGGGGAVATVW